MRTSWLIALALLVLYAPTYWDMSQGIWRSAEQGYAPLIALVAAWLAWRVKARLPDPAAVAPVTGSFLLVSGLLAYAGGRALQLPLFELGSQIPVFAGLLLLLGGRPWLRAFAFPLGFMLFMLPLPGILIDSLTSPIKEAISILAEELLYRAGYPVARNGVVLSLSQYRLLVADACTGLYSMIFLTALGLLYLHLNPRQSRKHVALMLAGILPIAFVANLARVLLLLLLTYHAGDAVGQGPLHDLTGVGVFLLALFLLFVLDALLSRTLPPPPATRPVPRVSRQGMPRHAAWLCIPLLAGAGGALALQPGKHGPGPVPPVDLEVAVPSEFGGWRQTAGPIAVAADATAATPYGTTLARTYVDAENRRIMLAIAHGAHQLGDAMQAHRPEYCYRAQGFSVGATSDGSLRTAYGAVPVRRLETRRSERSEPVSYWMMVGNQATLPGFSRKLAQVRQALSGRIPDGMLVRISSIDENPQEAYRLHDRFASDLLSALPEAGRVRMAGLGVAR